MKEKYIQLPPIPSDAPKEAVELAWEFMKFPKDRREVLLQELQGMNQEKCSEEAETTTDKSIMQIPEEEMQDFLSAIYKLIKGILEESCSLSVWVYRIRKEEHASLEEMIEMRPQSEGMIRRIFELIEE